jgi:hypothetical protein
MVMRPSKDSIRLQNTDLRWYRDKYLTCIFVVCLLGGLSLVWGWPPLHENLIRGTKVLSVAALCLVVSPQRFTILAGGMLIIFSRGLIGLVLYHSVGALIVGLTAGLIFCFLAIWKKLSFSPNYKVNDYSYSELVIDMAVLLFLIWVGIKLT